MTPIDIRATIQAAMRTAFPVVEQRVAHFYAMQEYHLGWRDAELQPALFDPGKLLRPQLAILACRAVGGQTEHVLPLAAAIQLIHDFTLIHDDIQDQSDMRRGRVTVWKQWGLAHGINVGDGMFIIAHMSLYRLTDAGVPAPVILDVLQRFETTNLKICEGQFLDLSFEGDLGISAADYLAMIERKTATLLAGAASMGAVVGGADAATVAALYTFGLSLGLAFQIQDDILGIWGDPAVTGKPRAADLYRRKLSLPIIYALRSDNEAAHPHRAELQQRYQQAQLHDQDVERVLIALEAAGSRRYCEEVALGYYQQALHALDQVQSGSGTEAAEALAQMRTMTAQLLGRQT